MKKIDLIPGLDWTKTVGYQKIIIYEQKNYFIINPNSRSKYVSKK
jgi:hypothetical protein